MTTVGWLPAGAEELFGAGATAEESYDVLTVDVPAEAWISALETARDRLGCTYFDWLSAVDEPGTGFRVAAHVAALGPVRRLLVRTTVPHESPALPTAVGVYAGAAWHERETHEMFGVVFEDHPALDHLLLPEGFEGHPLRKDFVLAARVAKAWPGAKEPGESDHGGPRRRQMLPPGVPDPNEWGPLKGQLPPAPARGAARAAGERPARRTRTPAGRTPPSTEPTPTARRARSVSEGSASQRSGAGEAGDAAGSGARPARRARSVSEGSASQRSGAGEAGDAAGSGARPARPARSVSEGSASQRTGSAAGASGAGEETPAAPKPAAAPPRSSDAPWHHARPAFDEPTEPVEKPGGPGSTEDDEATSATQESPERPESPTAPERSETPRAPEGPGASEATEAPATPGSREDPERRDAAQAPGTPERRGASQAPGAPEAPDASHAPEAPGTPEDRDAAQAPEAGPRPPARTEPPNDDRPGGPQ
ncbi:NADH-quinone oxidoreductase subunit C [Streptomyces sp. NPDC018947]|uniref:NADH-quinone oxidoreductase subunit C n=1 Tax=Streptomyces sp. NPDC018947 TaxID=3365054 RepID=UPI0037B62286